MQFVSPLFLIGLSAIAIPIAIHLFTFKRYKKVYFSSTDLLKEIQTETQKQSRLKHLIVLFLRILGIICLVVAFAQPFLPVDNTFIDEGESVVSVYVDNSFSMQNTSPNGTLLDEAKQKAKEIVSAYKLSDKFQLLTNDLDGKHQRFVSKEEFLQYLDEVDFSPVPAKLSIVMGRQFDFLKSKNVSSKKCYVISDFQKTVSDINQLPKDSVIQSFLIPLQPSNPDISNLYIDSLWFDSPVFRLGGNITVNVRIKNTGSETMEKVPVKLYINNKQQSLAGADIAGNSSQTLKLTFRMEKMGILHARISLTDYPIVFDDDFYFSILAKEHIPVLCINGTAENPYLNHLYSLDSSFHYKTMSSKNIDYADIPNYYFIILNQLTDIPSGLSESLEKFVQDGGGVLFFPNENLNAESYRQTLVRLKSPFYGNIDTARNKISFVNEKSPLYSGVFESMPENMDMPLVFRHFKLQSGAGTTRESLIKLQSGDDFLSVSYLGKGKVYVSSIPPDPAFSNFVKHSLFVPTLYNMALFSQPFVQPYYFLESNEIIDIPFQVENRDDVLKLVASDGSFECIPGFKQTTARAVLFLQGQLTKAGNYNLSKAGKNLVGLSFNYNRLESDMQAYSSSDLSKQLKDNGLVKFSVIKNTGKPIDMLIKQDSDIQLWKYFVVLALLMFLAEILILRFWK